MSRSRSSTPPPACTSPPHHTSIFCVYGEPTDDSVDQIRELFEPFCSRPEWLLTDNVDERKNYVIMTYQTKDDLEQATVALANKSHPGGNVGKDGKSLLIATLAEAKRTGAVCGYVWGVGINPGHEGQQNSFRDGY